jgi:hypothetical protein
VKLRFYADPKTELLHIYGHNVEEHEVEDILQAPAEDYAGKHEARVALGQTEAGRYLKVVYVPEADGAFVITAYELTGKPLTAFKRRQKRRKN